MTSTPTPLAHLRWSIFAVTAWLLCAVALLSTTYTSLNRPLDFRGTLAAPIAASDDPAQQRAYNTLLLKAVDNRIAAVKALQRKVVFASGGVLVSGVLVVVFLARLQRSLRREAVVEVRLSEE